ncbi:hypothetical protein Emag_002849 [Eimeria magna]
MSDAEATFEEEAVVGEAEAEAHEEEEVTGDHEEETAAEHEEEGEGAAGDEEENEDYPGDEEEVMGAPPVDLKDTELFKEWRSQGILRCVESADGGEPEVELPQVLVDGVVLGGETDLQELEEDGDLAAECEKKGSCGIVWDRVGSCGIVWDHWVFARAACPCCLHEKPTEASSCASCGAVFTSLIPADVLAAGEVQQMLQGYVYNAAEEAAGSSGGERLKERWASGLQQADFEWEGDGKREQQKQQQRQHQQQQQPCGLRVLLLMSLSSERKSSRTVERFVFSLVSPQKLSADRHAAAAAAAGAAIVAAAAAANSKIACCCVHDDDSGKK